ncbi:FHA domain-containing protein FHA2-like [Telopea speciosissima]|uniref:FHA domain-containing protein FHA2-like n=1 Tax=Telopea speciosissima TaxID=54955 RepID=UPI001CC75524|nr:FHA domain-containing protein FHA2-like [Telopea speciosissima]XP_043719239.1 FHA domain-containing protein FHA2-like [Telopea speciosissima]XP_043719240.1 FHA domain-containing protein FHA2-like [Telopea speciosissima]
MMGMTGSGSGSDVEAGFAKLQGEDFEYYMQTYSIILGRNSKKSAVDVDLSSLGGGMNISRHHARIFYDFQRRRFALEVLGKNGCSVEGVLHLPGNPPVKLDSQDLLQIGDKKFYFLLPVRSILGGSVPPRHIPTHHPTPPMPSSAGHLGPPARLTAPHPPPKFGTKKGRIRASTEYMADDDEDDEDVSGVIAASSRKLRGPGDGHEMFGYSGAAAGKAGSSGPLEKKGEARSRANRDADNHQLLQLEEKDVVSSVATVLSDLCGPGEWMPMAKLHTELVEQYGNIWHHTRVRRYLTSEDWPANESKGRPWYGLLTLLRKYPEHFVINTRSKGRVTSEFVSLVSLLT